VILGLTITTGLAIVLTAAWLTIKFIIFVWAKMNQPAFGVEIHEGATYIRKPCGQLIKIADYPYGKEDMARFAILAKRAQMEAEREAKHALN